MSKLRKSLPKEMLNVNPQIDVLLASQIIGDGIKIEMQSFAKQESRAGNKYVRFEALANDKKVSFFSNLLQSIIITGEDLEVLKEEGSVEGAKDANIFEGVESDQRLYDRVMKESDEEDESIIDFTDLDTFRIVATSVYFRTGEDGKNLESHPAIALRNYKDYDAALAARQAEDASVTYVTFAELMAHCDGKLPELKEDIVSTDPDVWSTQFVVTTSK